MRASLKALLEAVKTVINLIFSQRRNPDSYRDAMNNDQLYCSLCRGKPHPSKLFMPGKFVHLSLRRGEITFD